MQNMEWGFIIALYLFLGGISAGVLGISSGFILTKKQVYEPIARLGAFIAPFPAIIGTSLLVFDLGRPFQFFRLFTTFRPRSAMSIGAWLLSVFVGVAFVYMYTWLPEKYTLKPLDAIIKRLGGFSFIRVLLALLSLPLSAGVAIYTGVLLGTMSSRPFLNSALLPQIFLFSAVSVGAATIMLAILFFWEKTEKQHRSPETYQKNIRALIALDIGAIFVEATLIFSFMVQQATSSVSVAQSLNLVFGGPYTIFFWGGAIALGIVVPLFIEFYEVVPVLQESFVDNNSYATVKPGPVVMNKEENSHLRLGLTLILCCSVLAGGFLLRCVFLFAGQSSYVLDSF